MDFQVFRAWANTSKGIRQCQKADKVLSNGNVESAANHFSKALDYFATAAEHLAKAEDDTDNKADNLLGEGNQELQKVVDQYAKGDAKGAEKFYDKALDKYDEALDPVS